MLGILPFQGSEMVEAVKFTTWRPHDSMGSRSLTHLFMAGRVAPCTYRTVNVAPALRMMFRFQIHAVNNKLYTSNRFGPRFRWSAEATEVGPGSFPGIWRSGAMWPQTGTRWTHKRLMPWCRRPPILAVGHDAVTMLSAKPAAWQLNDNKTSSRLGWPHQTQRPFDRPRQPYHKRLPSQSGEPAPRTAAPAQLNGNKRSGPSETQLKCGGSHRLSMRRFIH